uniref:Meiosis-specific nuclear structural protein 1 n=1 Tax=Syphacia muris TaxID=451379 RepID=A0A0N5A7T0_9BILA
LVCLFLSLTVYIIQQAINEQIAEKQRAEIRRAEEERRETMKKENERLRMEESQRNREMEEEKRRKEAEEVQNKREEAVLAAIEEAKRNAEKLRKAKLYKHVLEDTENTTDLEHSILGDDAASNDEPLRRYRNGRQSLRLPASQRPVLKPRTSSLERHPPEKYVYFSNIFLSKVLLDVLVVFIFFTIVFNLFVIAFYINYIHSVATVFIHYIV